MTATFILTHDTARTSAKRAIDRAPAGFVVTIAERTRTSDQNDKMWAMLTDVARARPLGREHTADVWKMLFMQACGHESQFEMGLDNRPFPVGFRSSKLNKRQMADLITFIDAWGSTNGVRWSESAQLEAA